MAAPKNHAKAGGRKKGVPNKLTQDLRDSIKLLLEDEFPLLKGILADIRKENPVAYANIIEKYMAYIVPKRKDITTDGQPILPPQIIIEVETDEQLDRLGKDAGD